MQAALAVTRDTNKDVLGPLLRLCLSPDQSEAGAEIAALSLPPRQGTDLLTQYSMRFSREENFLLQLIANCRTLIRSVVYYQVWVESLCACISRTLCVGGSRWTAGPLPAPRSLLTPRLPLPPSLFRTGCVTADGWA